MLPWDYYSDAEQKIQAEAKVIEHEQRFAEVSKCLACLTHNVEVDADGLCDRPSCQGADAEHRRAIVALVTPN